MDELLAGLGKWIGTAEFGSAGDWVAGSIAAVALLITVVTQRRQTSELAREEGNSLLVDVGPRTFEGGDHDGVVVLTIDLANDSSKSKRAVELYLGPSDRNASYPPINKRPVVDWTKPEREVKRVTDRLGLGVEFRFGLLVGNEKATIVLDTRSFLDRQLLLYYTDSKGRRWRRDLRTFEVSRVRFSDKKQSNAGGPAGHKRSI